MDFDRTQIENERRNLHGERFGQNAAPQSRIARVISRSLFFAVILLLIPHIGPIFNDQGKFLSFDSTNPNSITKQEFYDLIDELKTAEILTKEKKSLVLIPGSNSINEAPNDYADYLRSMGADVVIENNFLFGGSFKNESFDIVFTLGQLGAGFVDRVLKSGGAVVVPAKDMSLNVYLDELNYTCVYLKPYSLESIIMVVVKPTPSDQSDAGELRRRPNWRYHKL